MDPEDFDEQKLEIQAGLYVVGEIKTFKQVEIYQVHDLMRQTPSAEQVQPRMTENYLMYKFQLSFETNNKILSAVRKSVQNVMKDKKYKNYIESLEKQVENVRSYFNEMLDSDENVDNLAMDYLVYNRRYQRLTEDEIKSLCKNESEHSECEFVLESEDLDGEPANIDNAETTESTREEEAKPEPPEEVGVGGRKISKRKPFVTNESIIRWFRNRRCKKFIEDVMKRNRPSERHDYVIKCSDFSVTSKIALLSPFFTEDDDTIDSELRVLAGKLFDSFATSLEGQGPRVDLNNQFFKEGYVANVVIPEGIISYLMSRTNTKKKSQSHQAYKEAEKEFLTPRVTAEELESLDEEFGNIPKKRRLNP